MTNKHYSTPAITAEFVQNYCFDCLSSVLLYAWAHWYEICLKLTDNISCDNCPLCNVFNDCYWCPLNDDSEVCSDLYQMFAATENIRYARLLRDYLWDLYLQAAIQVNDIEKVRWLNDEKDFIYETVRGHALRFVESLKNCKE